MTAATDDIARAIERVARAAVTAKSQNNDWLDQNKWSTVVGAAWLMIQHAEPKLYHFLRILLALDPYALPMPRQKETAAIFVARVRDDADCEVDIWVSGIRAGLDTLVDNDVTKAIARRLREPDGKRGAGVSRISGERVIAIKRGAKNEH